MQQDPVFNPYSPPTSDVNGTVWPTQSDSATGELRLAERGSRLGAAIIDGLLYVAAAIPAIAFAVLMGPSSRTAMLAIVVIGMLPLAIYQWYRVSTTGQTLAKKWLRIRIVKMDGSPVDFISGVFLRIWVPTLILYAIQFVLGEALPKIFNLVDVLFIFGASSRCVHDYLAGTKVVVA